MRDFRNPRYKVLRDREECIECDLCVRQCANEVHYRDEKTGALRADSMKCVNCQRCTLLCPTRALAITRWPQVDAGSAVWTEGAMDDITAQAQTGGVLLASMGNPKSYHIYWEHLLLNASQVTNPSIDPLREPMETRVVLGSRPSKLRVNERTRMIPKGTDAISPAPHHDIYSIEDLRQLIFSLKEATGYAKPVAVKVAAVHNVAAIASGMARAGADIIVLDGFRGGTGAAPKRIRDNVGIPIELALAAVDERLRQEGIRSTVSLVASGTLRNAADVVRAVALGADAVSIGSAALIAMGCHQCGDCASGRCNWGIATQRADLVARLNPEAAAERVVNLVSGWNREIQEMMGGMGINAIDSLRGNRLMLRGVGLNEKELEILGVKYAGE